MNELRTLPLSSIRLSQTTAQLERRAHFDAAKLDELAESIKSFGLLQPLVARPCGTLANKHLRTARRAVKEVFNPLWENVDAAYPGIPVRVGHVRQVMRTRAYEWLGEQMGLGRDHCHVAMFDEQQCAQAIDVIDAMAPTPASIRQWHKDRQPKKTRVRKAP